MERNKWTQIDADSLSAQNCCMAIAKQTKRVKRKTPNKKAHKDRAVYSLARKNKGQPDFQYAKGKHSNGANGALHEAPFLTAHNLPQCSMLHRRLSSKLRPLTLTRLRRVKHQKLSLISKD
jgi:hypothetical protein